LNQELANRSRRGVNETRHSGLKLGDVVNQILRQCSPEKATAAATSSPRPSGTLAKRDTGTKAYWA